MLTKENRPDLAVGTARESLSDPHAIPIDRADQFGRGLSQTEAYAANRRGLVALRDAWPDVVAQILSRALRQGFLEALPAYWLRRAETLEAVGTPAADESARTCRRHAWLLAQGLPEAVAEEVDRYLMGVA